MDSFFINLKAVLISLIFILFVIRVRDSMSLINKIRNNNEYIESLKFGIVSKKDLYKYTPFEFEHWCSEFLEKQGFSDIQVTPSKQDGGKDIICKKGIETYFVECKRYDYSINAQYKVDLEIARKLVGAMEQFSIKKGMIITTGYATEQAIEYVKSLPNNYNVNIIDGDELVRKYLSIRNLIYSIQRN